MTNDDFHQLTLMVSTYLSVFQTLSRSIIGITSGYSQRRMKILLLLLGVLNFQFLLSSNSGLTRRKKSTTAAVNHPSIIISGI